MSQFGLPDSNDNVLEEGNKLTSMSNRNRNEARQCINERRMDSVNICRPVPDEQLFSKLNS